MLRLPARIAPGNRQLTEAEFHRFAGVTTEVEWFANLSNAHTRRGDEYAIRDLILFTGISKPKELRAVTRTHIIARCDEPARRGPGGATIRHRLASLFEYLLSVREERRHP